MYQFVRPRSSAGKRFFTSPAHRSTRPRVEPLEPRALLTAVVVNTIVDAIYPVNSGIVSLRMAIATANSSATPTTISFDPSVFNGAFESIVLSGSGLVLSAGQATTITGPNTGVEIDGHAIGTALTISGGNVTLADIDIANATAGAIVNHGSLTMNGVQLFDNTGNGGLTNDAAAVLTSCFITGNTSTVQGGGIYNSFKTNLTVIYSQISGNQSTEGGGIYNTSGIVNLVDDNISGNSCTVSASRGGGVVTVGGRMTLNGVTLTNNSAINGGGADNALGTLTLLNCTVAGNTSTSDGGGVSNGDASDTGSGTLTVTNCTITGNTGRIGGGLFAAAGCTTYIANTIVAGNIVMGKLAAGPDADGMQASLGHNLIGKIDGSAGSWNTNDLTGTITTPLNAMLTSLSNTGGLWDTIVPMAASPAIDAGANAFAVDGSGVPLPTDPRGYPRIYHGTVDIGAVEFQPKTANVSPLDNAIHFSNYPGNQYIQWATGGTAHLYLRSDPEGMMVNGNSANDIVAEDSTGGSNPIPAILHLNGTFTITGLTGTDPFAGTTLDIGASTVFISTVNQGSNALATFLGNIRNGYNNSQWNGTPTGISGVITSTAAAANATHSTGIGYADSAGGLVALPANTLELKYTLYGDTALTGSVGFSDFMRMTQHYTLTGQTWGKGDFNYDGNVDSNDFNLLHPNYGQTLPAPLPAPAMSPIVVPPVTADAPPSNSSDAPPASSNRLVDATADKKVAKQSNKVAKKQAKDARKHG